MSSGVLTSINISELIRVLGLLSQNYPCEVEGLLYCGRYIAQKRTTINKPSQLATATALGEASSFSCSLLLKGVSLYTITLHISFVKATGSSIGRPSISNAWLYKMFVYSFTFSLSVLWAFTNA